MEFRVSDVCQTASGGSYVVRYHAEVEGRPCVNVGDHDGGVAATVPVLNTGRSRAGRACSTRRTGENTIRRA